MEITSQLTAEERGLSSGTTEGTRNTFWLSSMSCKTPQATTTLMRKLLHWWQRKWE